MDDFPGLRGSIRLPYMCWDCGECGGRAGGAWEGVGASYELPVGIWHKVPRCERADRSPIHRFRPTLCRTGELAPRPLEAVLRVVMRALVQACHGVNVTAAKRSRVPLCLRVTASGRQRPWPNLFPAYECPGNDLRPRGPAWYRSSPTLPQPYPARAPGL